MRKILVVDDEPDLLDITMFLLEMNSFEVCALPSGKDIETTIASFKPELILLDISLGDADGRMICRDIKTRQETSHLPVLLFSANLNVKGTLPSFLADGFVEKPFSTDELLNAVNAALPK